MTNMSSNMDMFWYIETQCRSEAVHIYLGSDAEDDSDEDDHDDGDDGDGDVNGANRGDDEEVLLLVEKEEEVGHKKILHSVSQQLVTIIVINIINIIIIINIIVVNIIKVYFPKVYFFNLWAQLLVGEELNGPKLVRCKTYPATASSKLSLACSSKLKSLKRSCDVHNFPKSSSFMASLIIYCITPRSTI